jgi:hypothetical protein
MIFFVVVFLTSVVATSFCIEASIGIDALQRSIDLRLFLTERHYFTLKTYVFYENNYLTEQQVLNANFNLSYHFNMIYLFKYLAVGADVGAMLQILDKDRNRAYDYYINLGVSIDYPLADKLHLYLNAPFIGLHRVDPNFFDSHTILQITSYPWELGLQIRFL